MGVNPFNYSTPVAPADLVGRAGEISRLLDAAWSGNNTRLVAPRRFGKTSLLKATLAEADRTGLVPVYVDFFGVLDMADIAERLDAAYGSSLTGTMAQWFASVRRSLAPIVRLGGPAAQVQLEPKARSLMERLDLPRRAHQRSGARVLVAFDEFQDVLQVEGADGLFRSVIQHHEGIAGYIFSGSHMHLMAELFNNRRRAFYGQARPVDVGPFSYEALAEFVARRFEVTGKSIDGALAPYLDSVRGHPQRAMLLAHILWDNTTDGATDEIWAATYEQALSEALEECRAAWDAMDVHERRLLTVVALDQSRVYSVKTGVPRGQTTTRAIRALVDRGEVVPSGSTVSGYLTVDPLLAEWIRRGRPGTL